jgi:hypothetical protein
MTLFGPHTFGPGTGDHAETFRRPPGELRRIWRWVRAHVLPAQMVLAGTLRGTARPNFHGGLPCHLAMSA